MGWFVIRFGWRDVSRELCGGVVEVERDVRRGSECVRWRVARTRLAETLREAVFERSGRDWGDLLRRGACALVFVVGLALFEGGEFAVFGAAMGDCELAWELGLELGLGLVGRGRGVGSGLRGLGVRRCSRRAMLWRSATVLRMFSR